MKDKNYMYPAVITKFAEDDYNVKFPDIEEINTFGSTLAEAYDMAEDALKLHLFDAYSDGIELQEPEILFIKTQENQTLIHIKANLASIITEYAEESIAN